MLRKVTFCFHSTTLCSYPCPTERLLPSLSHLGTARNPIAAAAPPPTMRRRRGSAAQPESRSFSPLAPPPTKTKDTSTSLSREYCCKALLSSCHSAVLTNWHQHYEVVRPNCGRNPNRIADFFSISFPFRQTMDLLPLETGTTRRCPPPSSPSASSVRPTERDQAPRSEKGRS